MKRRAGSCPRSQGEKQEQRVLLEPAYLKGLSPTCQLRIQVLNQLLHFLAVTFVIVDIIYIAKALMDRSLKDLQFSELPSEYPLCVWQSGG